MAIIKFTNSNHGLKAILRYVAQYAKTEARLVSGKDCMPESALAEMQTVKRMYGKDTGRQYIHLIQSFSPEEKLTHAQAHEIGVKLADRFPGFQAVIATHKDRGHIHNHIVLNSVNMDTGLKWQQSKKELQAVKDYSDSLCMERGLTVISEKSQARDMGINELKAAEKGESWKFKLMNAIDSAMENSANKGDFIANMERMGYGVKWIDHYKYITYTTPEGQKCRDNRLHDEKYLKERMEQHYGIGFEKSQRDESTRSIGEGTGNQSAGHGLAAGASAGIAKNAVGNRAASRTDAEENRAAADLDGLETGDHAGGQKGNEQPHGGGGEIRKKSALRLFQSSGQLETEHFSDSQQQAGRAGETLAGAGQYADKADVEMARNRGVDTAAVIGAVVAIENFLALTDPPKKEEQEQKQVTERKNRQKKKHKQSHDHEWEMSW
ncbi:MAG: relaxase/mobilization nuclease domain-containing protein [Oscillospiraceae bacterium]|jgi:hypothetical protein|nr:relaxase/mobilization nuclease domain-containing protein [Oscillospiraceae bacterium]